MKVGISPIELAEFNAVAEKLLNYNFAEVYLGSTTDLVTGFKTVNAALLFLEESLKDTTKLNLRKY